jgi:hypothetical protein
MHNLRTYFNATHPFVIGIDTVTPADAPIKVICGSDATTVNLLNVTSGEWRCWLYGWSRPSQPSTPASMRPYTVRAYSVDIHTLHRAFYPNYSTCSWRTVGGPAIARQSEHAIRAYSESTLPPRMDAVEYVTYRLATNGQLIVYSHGR